MRGIVAVSHTAAQSAQRPPPCSLGELQGLSVECRLYYELRGSYSAE